MSKSVQVSCLSEYTCKCDTCRRSCCISGDWDITLTRSEYLDICSRQLPDRLREIFSASVKQRQDGSEEAYAEIDYHENRECAFLEDGFCIWQKMTGDSIGTVCRDFPRKKLRYLDTVYVFPTCACERITELMLASEDAAVLSESEADPGIPLLSISVRQTEKRPLLKHMRELFEAQRVILRNRTHSFDERMMILTAALFAADSMEKEGLEDRVASMMTNISRSRGDELLLDICGNPADSDNRIKYAQAMFSVFTGSRTYGGMARKVVDQLSSPEYPKKEEAVKGFLKEKEPFLENVMLSSIMYHVVPLENPGIIESAVMITSLYIMLKTGIAALWHSELSDEELIDITVEVHRMFSHNSQIRAIELEYLSQYQLMNLPGILSLVR